MVKNMPANVGDTGSIPGWGRSPEGGNGNPLQCSCLENPMDRGAWGATVHGVAKSQMLNERMSTAQHKQLKSRPAGFPSTLEQGFFCDITTNFFICIYTAQLTCTYVLICIFMHAYVFLYMHKYTYTHTPSFSLLCGRVLLIHIIITVINMISFGYRALSYI